jgi:hypothetical protein
MLKRMLNRVLGRGPTAGAQALSLPSIDRERIAHLLAVREGLPQVDWGMTDAWLRKGGMGPDGADLAAARRAVTAAWLDELRDALSTDHRRWRRAGVEGLGPLGGNLSVRIADAADESLKVIAEALRPIRGDEPIPPVAVVAIGSTDDYYSFVSHFYGDEGEWATSAGMYIRGGEEVFPLLVLDAKPRWGAEETVAHELTHHALVGRELPRWAEEGLTQMMEERVTGRGTFHVDRPILERHRGQWSDPENLSRFWDGETFSSAEGEEQELSYHLAQMVVRGLLTREPKAFFALARACKAMGAEAAAAEHLSTGLDEVVYGMLGIGEGVED